MALMDDLRTKLTAIGEAIRRKTSGSEPLTMDAMVEAINNITTGGTNIEDGYTINFYDADNILIQSHSAKYGYWVDQPITHIVDHWEDASGNLHMFPLVVTADMGIEAVDVYEAGPATIERLLYKHFGVDKSVYTHLVVASVDSAGTEIGVFFGAPSGTNNIILRNSGGYYLFFSQLALTKYAKMSGSLTGDMSMDVIKIITNLLPSSLVETGNAGFSTSGAYQYTNWDDGITDGRLDETLYVAQKTCAQKLYEYYGISQSEYPYVLLHDVSSNNDLSIIFAEKITHYLNTSSNTYGIKLTNYVSATTQSSLDLSDVNNVLPSVKAVLQNIRTADLRYTVGSTDLYAGAAYNTTSAAIAINNSNFLLEERGNLTAHDLNIVYTE